MEKEDGEKNTWKKILWRIFIMVLVLTPIVSASLNVQLSDQGTGVSNSSGSVSGNLSVLIYDNETAGNLIYNETFSSAISNGSWNVMLGSGSGNLPLEYGKIYYKDYLILGEDVSFDGNDRQAFYSPLGDINGSDLASDITINTTGTGFFNWLGSLINRITSLFVQDINFNGTMTGEAVNISSETGNIETFGNISLNDISSEAQIYLKGGELIIGY